MQTGHHLSPQVILISSLRNTSSNYTPHGYQEQKEIAKPYACKCHLFPQEKNHLYFAIKEQKVFFPINTFQSRNIWGGDGFPGGIYTAFKDSLASPPGTTLLFVYFLIKLWRINFGSGECGKPLLKKSL